MVVLEPLVPIGQPGPDRGRIRVVPHAPDVERVGVVRHPAHALHRRLDVVPREVLPRERDRLGRLPRRLLQPPVHLDLPHRPLDRIRRRRRSLGFLPQSRSNPPDHPQSERKQSDPPPHESPHQNLPLFAPTVQEIEHHRDWSRPTKPRRSIGSERGSSPSRQTDDPPLTIPDKRTPHACRAFKVVWLVVIVRRASEAWYSHAAGPCFAGTPRRGIAARRAAFNARLDVLGYEWE